MSKRSYYNTYKYAKYYSYTEKKRAVATERKIGAATIAGMTFIIYRHARKPMVIYRSGPHEFRYSDTLWQRQRPFIETTIKGIIEKEHEQAKQKAIAVSKFKALAPAAVLAFSPPARGQWEGDEPLKIEVDKAQHMPHAALVARRMWRIDLYNGVLRSTAYPHVWEPGEKLTAFCQRSQGLFEQNHQPPVAGCTCGFYAIRPHIGVGAILGTPGQTHILGEVYLWGRILHGEHGFRAQYTYPKKFIVMADEKSQTPWWVAPVLEPFNVPIEIVRQYPTDF